MVCDATFKIIHCFGWGGDLEAAGGHHVRRCQLCLMTEPLSTGREGESCSFWSLGVSRLFDKCDKTPSVCRIYIHENTLASS